jgi:hypothetical protein
MGSSGYGYSQPYWGSESNEEGSYRMPAYYSLSPGRYQRSARGYYILPPNFSDDEPQTEGR